MDMNYWTKYYSANKQNSQNSLFADFVLQHYLAPESKLLELGCGNGRDSIYFAKNGIKVSAIDQVQSEIEYLQSLDSSAPEPISTETATVQKSKNTESTTAEYNPPKFISADFTRLDNIALDAPFDCIYSRFTLHSITQEEQQRLLAQIPSLLAPCGMLAIEARGLKNSLYQKGEAVAGQENAFIYDSHYRRFIDFDKLCAQLAKDFKVIFAKENSGFAPFGDEDDYFFRVIALWGGGGG